MKRYYYIVMKKSIRTSIPDFCHVAVMAEDEEDAYVKGHARMAAQHPQYTDHKVRNGGDWNDYVIEVRDAEFSAPS